MGEKAGWTDGGGWYCWKEAMEGEKVDKTLFTPRAPQAQGQDRHRINSELGLYPSKGSCLLPVTVGSGALIEVAKIFSSPFLAGPPTPGCESAVLYARRLAPRGGPRRSWPR